MKRVMPVNLYIRLEQDYWSQPRDVCVVDEIRPLPGGSAELFIYPPYDKELAWIKRVVGRHGATITVVDLPDRDGRILITVENKKGGT